MDRKELHPKIVDIIRNYYDQETKAANKILDLFSVSFSEERAEVCSHKDCTRTSDDYVYCHDCDEYIFKPKQT